MTFKKKDKKKLTSIKMTFFRRTAGCTLFDHKRNEKTLEELKVEPVDEKLRRYKWNWLQHVTRRNNSRMPKIMLSYRPNGWRRFGRLLKRLLCKDETGLLRPNARWIMMVMCCHKPTYIPSSDFSPTFQILYFYLCVAWHSLQCR